MSRSAILVIVSLLLALPGSAEDGLNRSGAPRYGSHVLAPGFQPAPATFDALSGGEIDVKALRLGDNCLGYAASDPDFLVRLQGEFSRVAFLIASQADTTLVISLPDGAWACDDDTKGMNPALVFFKPQPGAYRIWIGSYAAEAYDESALYVSEAGLEALPTTATGPEPERAPLYGEISLAPGFQPSPFTIQIVGGGRNRSADFLAEAACGFVSEAPDFTVTLGEDFREIMLALYSRADMTLLVNAPDGSWHCGADQFGAYAGVRFSHPLAGHYDVWVGSADEGNYAASVFYATEQRLEEARDFTIDSSCDGMLETALRVGARAIVKPAAGARIKLYAAPETASTVVFQATPGSALKLVGGPVCKADHRWWRAELSDAVYAWLADGDASRRWLEPAG